ncbi:transcriptional regulator [Allofrancisella guangzhouensis]|uniref:MarR family transcriptional regulator n=1 Tax=Allofrancisella guangzhouensis TaxID=594679 RepID=A0A0A8EAC9_9GAMM|nr:transcriptional regulator [Allofrancisella guangzhouensis]AJC49096.1 MarR family transcriptional regulator [Allofrancisella guangzhouensis]MBK2026926.1 transcriptional regulator [Allofrancisella guangzhouensis]MBK2044846.1 transcriptional regulator [Allofrancisella guangzhouensis]MBK2046306.1 transcriptional regulator [Allofrancisella guangzhouensis]
MLSDIFHQPIRTKIITYLYSTENACFKDIKTLLELTDGHMSTHMRVFVKNGYIASKKSFKSGKPITTYSITEKGKEDFLKYLGELECIVKYVKQF